MVIIITDMARPMSLVVIAYVGKESCKGLIPKPLKSGQAILKSALKRG